MRRHLLLTSALALTLAVPAIAQEVLPETVVTATRIPTPAERVPAAITVLTRTDIEERGYQTLTEALRAVPGVRVAQEGGPGQRASAFVRGSNSSHVLVLLDGVPVNDPSEPNGAFNFGNELLGEIERIEVVRGPASSLYGSGALGGVVNLVTRRAPEGRAFVPFGEVAAGTQRTVRGTAGFAGQSGAVDYLFSAQSLSTRGFDVTAPRLAGNTGERDGLRAAAATARLGVRLDAGTRVEALLRWRENTFGYDNIPREDPNLEGNDRRLFGQIRGETTLLGGAWVTGLRLARTEDRRVARNEPDAASPSASRDIYRGERVTLDWSNRVRLGDLGALRDNALAFGLTRTEDRLESDTANFGSPFSIRAGTSSLAAHAGVQSRIASRLDVALGLRHDEPEDYAGFTSWRAGGVYALPEIASRLRASAGTAFRAPSLEQRFGSAFARGNPELRPERSLGWEVGIETDVPGLGRDDLATVSATWFENRFRNLMVYDFAGRIVRNVDRAKVEGAELGLTLRPAAWLEADASWTITDAVNEATGRRLARRPQNIYVFRARVAPLPRLVIVPEVVVNGRQVDFVYPSAGEPGFGRNGLAQGGTVANLTVSYGVAEGVTAFAEGRNLGNSRYEPANGYLTPGRSLLVGTRFTF